VGGRLELFWRDWEKHGSDPYIVQLLREGYKIPFRHPAPVSLVPTINSQYEDPLKNSIFQQAVLDMLAKHAIEPVVDPSSPGFHSRLFLVPKKTGDWRPIIDLSTSSSNVPHSTWTHQN
jgi:hypothetical protein